MGSRETIDSAARIADSNSMTAVSFSSAHTPKTLSVAAAILVSIVRSTSGYKPPFPIPKTQSAFHPLAQRNACRRRDVSVSNPDCAPIGIQS
jgi:hypothetical protein